MDEGWTRWLLENFGFTYATLHNADIQAGNLRARFDSIVFADESANAIENGHQPGTMPAEFTGGLGSKGAAALQDFAGAGGTLIFLNRASTYAIEKLGLKATPVQDFYSPGSLLNVKLDLRDSITRGLPAEIAIWSESSPVWTTEEPAVAKFTDTGVLASGWLIGEKNIAGKTALIHTRYGAGQMILFGMRPQYRAQSYATFKLFFNALLN
jgi:hypothetical protein